MKDRIYLALFKAFRWIVLHTPRKVEALFIKALARAIYLLDAKHRHIARVNLDLAFEDELSEKEKERIVKKTYENLLFNLADFVRNQGISKDELLKKVKFINPEIVEEAKRLKKPIIFITAHYGNWELLPLAVAAKFGPLTGVGRALDSKIMDQILRANREQFDIKVANKKGALKELIRAIKEGRSVGLLVDQNTTDSEGLLIKFFGKDARHTHSAALLALRMGAIIIPAFITTEDHIKFKIEFYEPIEVSKEFEKDEAIKRCVQEQANVTERAIRKKPDEWFWLHQRWKNRFEELYRR